jgi:cell division protein FtsI/penicillin-binding protein 2
MAEGGFDQPRAAAAGGSASAVEYADQPAPVDRPERAARNRAGAGRHSAPSGRVRLPRSSGALAALVVAVVVVLVAAAVGVFLLLRPRPKPATPVAQTYLAAWSERNFAAMAALVDFPPTDFTAQHMQMVTTLGVASWRFQLGKVTTKGKTAQAAFSARIVLGGIGTWTYQDTLHLAMVSGTWKVEWTPAAIYPTLPVGGHLNLETTWPQRATVLGTGGTVLAGSNNGVIVGLQGNAVTSPSLVTSALTQAGFAPSAISNALKTAAARPAEFVPVGTISQAKYQQVRSIIFPVPGTRFQTEAANMSATPDLAAHVVGSVGPITAQELKQLGPPYRAGDSVGTVGIESEYEHQLAGRPTAAVQVVGPDGTVMGTPISFPGKAGSSVQTTLDLPTQKAAEAALNGESLPAALVVIQASTGAVLAAVSRPDGTSFDRALQGQYPPGSTFKVITSSALLASGLTPQSPATCPSTITVDGYTFHNFDGESALHANLLEAFEQSCNAAFIGLSQNLPSQSLLSAASQFGFGTTLEPGLPVFGGQIPTPVDEVEKVADSIGQGRVLASPLQMASVAAAVDSGAYHAPRLVTGVADDTRAPIPLSAPVVASLKTMMAGVVTNGTGLAANVGGQTVYGKTGTAEFGNANPPMTHAWFIGFQGDIAFAVVVEGGGVGGTVAAPIAGRFLRLLASSGGAG